MIRILDAFASRLGTVVAVLALVVMSVSAIALVRGSAEKVRSIDALGEMSQVRHAFVALNDLMHLSTLLTEVGLHPEVGPEQVARISAALDKLYVRAEDLHMRNDAEKSFAMTNDAVAALRAVVAVGDAALANQTTDAAEFVRIIQAEVERARKEIYIQPHKMAALEQSVVDRQSLVLQRIFWFAVAAVIVFTFLEIVSLVLLQREVKARQQREKAEDRASFLAYFDPLTGLPNRVRFRDEVEAALAENPRGAIAYVDLDRFKSINDTYGHAMGDAVLKHMSSKLREVADTFGALPARLSGDEFAIYLPTERLEKLRMFGDSLMAAVVEPVSHNGNMVVPSLSIGLAAASDTDQSFDDILRSADFALYVSKENGRGCATVYDKQLERQLAVRREILEDLPRALAADALDVHLQSKVTLPNFDIYGFEALVRWRRKGEFVPVDILIELAEKAGLVTEIDLFVMRHAVALLAEFNRAHDTEFSVSVNLSALHFIDDSVVHEVASVLEDSDLPPHLLTLEITESEQLANWDSVRAIMTSLHDLGCRISIDDFGTGYSSLAYLRAMPADEVKIDRSLVGDIDQSTQAHFVLDAIVDLATGLNMSVVVEGIERSTQAKIIHSMGCRYAQGFLFGKPMPAAEALQSALHRDEDDPEPPVDIHWVF